jgi:hypothetical protein
MVENEMRKGGDDMIEDSRKEGWMKDTEWVMGCLRRRKGGVGLVLVGGGNVELILQWILSALAEKCSGAAWCL